MEISTFLISNCPSLNSGQFRDKKSLDLHEKSLDLSNYEIFPHKILKSRTFKKSSILIVIMYRVSCLFLCSLLLRFYTWFCSEKLWNLHEVHNKQQRRRGLQKGRRICRWTPQLSNALFFRIAIYCIATYRLPFCGRWAAVGKQQQAGIGGGGGGGRLTATGPGIGNGRGRRRQAGTISGRSFSKTQTTRDTVPLRQIIVNNKFFIWKYRYSRKKHDKIRFQINRVFY